jgi:hypothetical protein
MKFAAIPLSLAAFSLRLRSSQAGDALDMTTPSGASAESALEYGVDVSFPMHHANVSTDNNPLGDKQQFYEDLINGCVDHYNKESDGKGLRCLSNEKDRVEMSLRQPKSMYNYTQLGYTKIRAPEKVFKLIKEFWDANKKREKPERWPAGNTYVNHWTSPTYMVSVEDTALEGGGHALKQMIWNAARDTISEWTGQQLAECSLYGIRVYKEGAVLAPHVDRLPLVSSAIINVDQDVDEPWPLEVIGHDGKATNVTMVPGDLVLYESHSILHGRPFPLKGRFMANVFVHFEPLGKVGEELNVSADLPSYVIPGSEEESNWRKKHPNGYKLHTHNTAGASELHKAAQIGDSAGLKRILAEKPELVNAKDVNGWTPLLEAVRDGTLENVQALISAGANVNARTKLSRGGEGGSVLHWAYQYFDDDHDIVKLLKEWGAKNMKPGSSTHDEL